jgi:hypothetical protein
MAPNPILFLQQCGLFQVNINNKEKNITIIYFPLLNGNIRK